MDIRNKKEELLEVTHVNNYYDDNGLGILRKRGKKQVLHDISFTIHPDEFFGLVGESGCGKSTLGNAILNLIPYEGSIRLDGRETSKEGRKEFTKKVQAVFQDPMSALNPRKTIGFTLREPLLAHGIGTPKEQMEEVNRMLERIGLDASYADRYPKELSGGQRQRVCIGAALMLNPELVIADEAVSALDVSVGAQILNLFRDIDRKRDFAMLFISHNLNVVYYLCDRIAVMYAGRIMELAPAGELFRNPLNPYTYDLLRSIPSMERKGKKLYSIEGTPPALDQMPKGCPFAPRCELAGDRCREEVPELLETAEGHFTRCFYREKLEEMRGKEADHG